MNPAYIHTSFLRGFSTLILSQGGNLAALYQSAGLERDLFIQETTLATEQDTHRAAQQDSLVIPFDKFIRLLEATAEQLNFPDIAMQLARQQDMMLLTPMSPLIRGCRTISEVLDTILKYLRILVSGYDVDIDIQKDITTLTFTIDIPNIEHSRQYQDYAMASAVTIIRALLGGHYPIRACYFLRGERDQQTLAEYSRYFGCPVAFSCPRLSLVVDSEILNQDVRSLVQELEKRIAHAVPRGHRDLMKQLAQVISVSLTQGRVGIDDAAYAMNMSTRTLQRHLSQHKTSYRSVLDSVRFNMANQYLKNTYYRLTDIALLLAYNDLSSFSRSYQRWCGVSPQQARLRMKHQIEQR